MYEKKVQLIQHELTLTLRNDGRSLKEEVSYIPDNAQFILCEYPEPDEHWTIKLIYEENY